MLLHYEIAELLLSLDLYLMYNSALFGSDPQKLAREIRVSSSCLVNPFSFNATQQVIL